MLTDPSDTVGIGTANPATNLHVVGATASQNQHLIVENYANGARLMLRRANGSLGAPTAILAGEVLGNFGFSGYETNGWLLNPITQLPTNAGIFRGTAAETFTNTAWGTHLSILNTPTGSTTQVERMRFDANGNVGIAKSDPAFKLDVNGEINATGLRINGLPIATGGSTLSATNLTAGQFGQNVGGGSYSFPGNVDIGGTITWGSSNSRTDLKDDAGAAASKSGFFETASPTNYPAGASSWWHLIEARHSNNSNNYALQIAGSFFDQNLYTRKTNANGATGWSKFVLQDASGNVGIGTSTPGARLDVSGTVRSGNGDTNAGNHPTYGTTHSAFWRQGADYSLLTDGTNTFLNAPVSTGNIYFRSANVDKLFVQGSTGNVGIGNTNPAEKLDIAGNIKVTGTGNITAAGTITGGTIVAKYQDVAEWVPSTHALPAGTVVTLDPTKSNHVEASSQAYDTRVAGVISAQPGITLGEKAENKVLVATTGRVRIKVDASHGPIQIGDLLVTSDISGVAMKSVPIEVGGRLMHMPGTLIGKALEPLKKGTGEILVLLSLQ